MSTRIEIRAEAMALHVMGYSCRKIEKQLRAKFPDANIPNYATISRWVRTKPIVNKAASRLAVMRWNQAAYRAADIVLSRMDEIARLPPDKAVACYGRIMDMAVGAGEIHRRS